MASKTTTSGDWREDQRNGYVAHFDEASGKWDGPQDAFVWRGLPFEGFPYSNEVIDAYDNKPKKVPHFFDNQKVSKEIGGVPVEWIEWDAETSCNVYRRLA
jgi:hypothetical protein